MNKTIEDRVILWLVKRALRRSPREFQLRRDMTRALRAGMRLQRLSDRTTYPTPQPIGNAGEAMRESAAKVAECAFDDRPRSRSGHHSEMDWTDGYREGTRAAAAAIRALPLPANAQAEESEGACTCQRHPTHCANDCPLHGLEEG